MELAEAFWRVTVALYNGLRHRFLRGLWYRHIFCVYRFSALRAEKRYTLKSKVPLCRRLNAPTA